MSPLAETGHFEYQLAIHFDYSCVYFDDISFPGVRHCRHSLILMFGLGSNGVNDLRHAHEPNELNHAIATRLRGV